MIISFRLTGWSSVSSHWYLPTSVLDLFGLCYLVYLLGFWPDGVFGLLSPLSSLLTWIILLIGFKGFRLAIMMLLTVSFLSGSPHIFEGNPYVSIEHGFFRFKLGRLKNGSRACSRYLSSLFIIDFWIPKLAEVCSCWLLFLWPFWLPLWLALAGDFSSLFHWTFLYFEHISSFSNCKFCFATSPSLLWSFYSPPPRKWSSEIVKVDIVTM